MIIDYIKIEIERKIINNEPLTYWEYVKVMNDDSIEIPYMMRVINKDSGEIETKYRPSDYDLPLHQYFTIELLEDNTEITYNNKYDENYLYYSINYGLTWDIFEHGDGINWNRGDKILFCSEWLHFSNKKPTVLFGNAIFSISNNFNVRGNIKSLYHGHFYETEPIYCDNDPLFEYFFKGQPVIDASQLVLSFEQLTPNIYTGMFLECNELEYGPQIRCHTLAQKSLERIFGSCTNLKSFQIDSLEFPNNYNGLHWIYSCSSLEKIIVNPNASIDWLYYINHYEYMHDNVGIDLQQDLPNGYIFIEHNNNIDIIKIRQDKLWIWVDYNFTNFTEEKFNKYEKLHNRCIPNKMYNCVNFTYMDDLIHHLWTWNYYSKDDYLYYMWDVKHFYIYTGETIEYDDKTWYVFGPIRKFNFTHPNENTEDYLNYLMIDSINFSKENVIRYTRNTTSKYNIIKFGRDQDSQSYNLDNILNDSPNTKEYQLYDFGYDIPLPYMKVYITKLNNIRGSISDDLKQNSKKYFYESDKESLTDIENCDYQVCWRNISDSMLNTVFDTENFDNEITEYILVDSIYYNNQILYLWERNNYSIQQLADNNTYNHYLLSNTINFDNEAIAVNNKPIFIIRYDTEDSTIEKSYIINKYLPFYQIGYDINGELYNKAFIHSSGSLVFIKFEGDLYDSAYKIENKNPKYIYISNKFCFNGFYGTDTNIFELGNVSYTKFYYIGKIIINDIEYYAWKYTSNYTASWIENNLVFLTKYYDFFNEDTYVKNTSYTTLQNCLSSEEFSKAYIIDGMFISVDNNISGYRSLDELNTRIIYLYNYSINSTNPLLSWIEIVDIKTLDNLDREEQYTDVFISWLNDDSYEDFNDSILKYELVGKSILNNGEIRYIWKNVDDKIRSEFLRFLVTATDTFSKDDMLVYNRNSLYNPVLGFISFEENDYINYDRYNFNFNYADVHELIDVSTQKLVYYEQISEVHTSSKLFIDIDIAATNEKYAREHNNHLLIQKVNNNKVYDLIDIFNYDKNNMYLWKFNENMSNDQIIELNNIQYNFKYLLTNKTNYYTGESLTNYVVLTSDQNTLFYDDGLFKEERDENNSVYVGSTKIYNTVGTNQNLPIITIFLDKVLKVGSNAQIYYADIQNSDFYGSDKVYTLIDYIKYNDITYYLWVLNPKYSQDYADLNLYNENYFYYLLTNTINYDINDIVDGIYLSPDHKLSRYDGKLYNYEDFDIKVYDIIYHNDPEYDMNYEANIIHIDKLKNHWDVDNYHWDVDNYEPDKIFNYTGELMTYNNEDWYLWEYDFDHSNDKSPSYYNEIVIHYLLTKTRKFRLFDYMNHYECIALNNDNTVNGYNDEFSKICRYMICAIK